MPTISLDSRQHWNATGFRLEIGRSYRIQARAAKDEQGRGYNDAGIIPCSPDGPLMPARLYMNLLRDARSPLHPAGWMRRDKIKRLRVLRDRNGASAHFLTVIGCIGRCEESELESRTWIIGSGCEIRADASGELFCFCNDWPGDPTLPQKDQPYPNNTGAIVLEIAQI